MSKTKIWSKEDHKKMFIFDSPNPRKNNTRISQVPKQDIRLASMKTKFR